MNKIKQKIIFLALILILISVSGCSARYVCYDGTVEKKAEDCPTTELPNIVQRQAELAVDTFSSAYAQALQSRHHRVNTYREGADWYSEVIFTNIRTESINHVKLKIDGKTSSVSCVEGCDYFDRQKIEEIEGINLNETTNN